MLIISIKGFKKYFVLKKHKKRFLLKHGEDKQSPTYGLDCFPKFNYNWLILQLISTFFYGNESIVIYSLDSSALFWVPGPAGGEDGHERAEGWERSFWGWVACSEGFNSKEEGRGYFGFYDVPGFLNESHYPHMRISRQQSPSRWITVTTSLTFL